MRYITDNLTKAHTRPMAQYTLVNIKGRNSSADPSLSALSASLDELPRWVVRRGNAVTKSCRSGNPAR